MPPGKTAVRMIANASETTTIDPALNCINSTSKLILQRWLILLKSLGLFDSTALYISKNGGS